MPATRKSSEMLCCRSASRANSILHVRLRCLAHHRPQSHLLVAAVVSMYVKLPATSALTVVSASPSAKCPISKKQCIV